MAFSTVAWLDMTKSSFDAQSALLGESDNYDDFYV